MPSKAKAVKKIAKEVGKELEEKVQKLVGPAADAPLKSAKEIAGVSSNLKTSADLANEKISKQILRTDEALSKEAAPAVDELAAKTKQFMGGELPEVNMSEIPSGGVDLVSKQRAPMSKLQKGAGAAVGIGAIGYGVNKLLPDNKQPPALAVPSTEEEAVTKTTTKKPAVEFAKYSTDVPETPSVAAAVRTAISSTKIPEAPAGTPLPESVAEEKIMTTDAAGNQIEVTPTQILQEHANTTAQLANDYKAAKNLTEKRATWEALVNAMGMLVAGIYGLRSGLDMGGTKFNTTDWAEKARQQQDDYRTGLAEAGNKLTASRAALSDRDQRKAAAEASSWKRWEANEALNKKAWDAAMSKLGLDLEQKKMLLSAIASDKDDALKRFELINKTKSNANEDAYKQALLQIEQEKQQTTMSSKDFNEAAKLNDEMNKALIEYGESQDKGDDNTAQAKYAKLVQLNDRYKQLTGAGRDLASLDDNQPDVEDILAAPQSTTATGAAGEVAFEQQMEDGRTAQFDKNRKFLGYK